MGVEWSLDVRIIMMVEKKSKFLALIISKVSSNNVYLYIPKDDEVKLGSTVPILVK